MSQGFNFYCYASHLKDTGRKLIDVPLANKLSDNADKKFVRAMYDHFKFHEILRHDENGHLVLKTFHTWWELRLNKNKKIVDLWPLC